MQIVEFNMEKHYGIYKGWCEGHGVGVTPPTLLQTPGYAVEVAGKIVCCCWAYMAVGTGIFWMAWITTNPALKPLESYRYLKFLVDSVEEIMVELDYHVAFTNTNSTGLVSFLKSRGWETNHTDATQLARRIA